MSEFVASNDTRISDDFGIRIGCSSGDREGHHLTPDESDALREFIQHERDEELGRWRWPEHPHYVVYLRRRPHLVVNELTGDSLRAPLRNEYTDTGHGTIYNAAAAYFEAHPERKPWSSAQVGEVWAVTIGGVERALLVDEEQFTDGNEGWYFAEPEITDARKIWPEDAS